MIEHAIFSQDKLHRFTLWRRWQTGDRVVNFICLNPSTADDRVDDPTVAKCVKYSKWWGYDALIVTNVFSYRSTDPSVLKTLEQPTMEDNDAWIKWAARQASLIICAWSQHAKLHDRGAQVHEMLREQHFELHYLKKSGQPHHPLYLKDDLKPTLWHA